MKRKTSSTPTRIWSFGALEPTENQKLLLDQLKHLGNSELVFSPQVVNSILEFNKDDIEWVQGLVGETITDLPTAVTHTVIASEEDLVSTALKQRDNLLAMLFNLKKSRALTVENLAGLVDDLRYELADHNSDGSQPLAEPSSFDINKEFLAVARHAEAEPADILREVALARRRSKIGGYCDLCSPWLTARYVDSGNIRSVESILEISHR